MSERTRPAATAAPRFQCVVAEAPDLERAEHAFAEAMAAGASGAEQRESERGVTWWIYAADVDAEAVRAAAAAVLGAGAVRLQDVESRDWSEAWKEGLRAVEVSSRLRVRPSFDATPPRAGQRDLVVDPGQAFGTGGHESTRLALEALDALHEELARTARVLDVGTGTGVLALAALALGAARATAFDLDPLAGPAARENAGINGLAPGLALFTGPLDALAPSLRFGVVVANLLRRELEPLIPQLVARVEAGGALVVSGLLEAEVDGVRARCEAEGAVLESVRVATDASGVDWAGLVLRRWMEARVMRRRADARG